MAKAKKLVGLHSADLLGKLEAEFNKDPEGYAWVKSTEESVQINLGLGQITLNQELTNGDLVAARFVPESDRTNKTKVVPNGAARNGAADGEEMETMEDTVQIVDGVELAYIPMTEPKRGGMKKEDYPWSKMEVGQSFLVPVTDKWPEPWKTFQSNVASNTRRFAEKVEGEVTAKGNPKKKPTRKFALRRVTKGDTYPNGYVEPSDGARVFRTA